MQVVKIADLRQVNPAPSPLLDEYDGTVKYDGVSNYGQEDLLYKRNFPESEGANILEVIPKDYNYSDIPQIYHQMVDETLTRVTTARYQHSVQKQLLWDQKEQHVDDEGRVYDNIHYKIGNSNEEYDPIHVKLYENWPTSVVHDQAVPSQLEIDKLIEGTINPIQSRQYSSQYQSSVVPNEVRFKQNNRINKKHNQKFHRNQIIQHEDQKVKQNSRKRK